MTVSANRDARRIADILEHLESIRAELRVGRDAFARDTRAQKIVAYDLLIVGEAAGHISRRTQAANRGIPWKRLGDYRNELIHAYETLDLDETWEFVREELPSLEEHLRKARVIPSPEAAVDTLPD